MDPLHSRAAACGLVRNTPNKGVILRRALEESE